MRDMKLLSEIEPEAEVTVKRIEGGSEAESTLKDLGVEEGTELTVVATEPVHMHAGSISIKTKEGEAIMARGWADKVYVEKEGKTLPLLRLEEGEKGSVKSIEGGKDFEGWLSEFGIEKEKELEFIRHIPDYTLLFKIDGREIKMGEGRASKLLVERGGKSIQINYLKKGEMGKVSKIVGGASLKGKFGGMEIKEGAEVTFIGKEMPAPAPKRGSYVLAKMGEQLITIGRGLAGKVWVDEK